MMTTLRILLLAMMIFMIGQADAQHPEMIADRFQRVLYINSYHRGYLWSDGIERGFRECLNASGRKIDIFIEFLDTQRFSGLNHLETLSEVFAVKHGNVAYDAIVVSDNNAFDFAVKYRDRIFPNPPIIFCGYNSFRHEAVRGITNITGVNEEVDFAGTIDMALAIHPKTETLVLITSDYYIAGQRNQEIVEKILIPDYQKTYRIIQLRNLYLQELEQQLSALPPRTLVFVFGAPLDNLNAQFIASEKYYSRMAAASSAPAYSFWDFTLNTGMMGGNIITGPDQGRKAAELTLKILDGSPADSIPVTMKSPTTKIFDFNTMKRFGISERFLPRDSIIINLPDTLYRRYQKYVLSIVIVFAAFSVMVTILAILLGKSRILSKKLREQQDHLSELVAERTSELNRANESLSENRQLLRDFVDTLPLWIARTDTSGIYQIVNKKYEIFGKSVAEIEGCHYSKLLPPNLCASHEPLIRAALSGENPEFYENLLQSDGYIHAYGKYTPVRNADGEIIGVSVFVIDITDLKRVEEALRQSEERFRAIFEYAGIGIALLDADKTILMSGEN